MSVLYSRQRGTHMLTLKKHHREGILVISQKVKNVPDSQILFCVVTGLHSLLCCKTGSEKVEIVLVLV